MIKPLARSSRIPSSINEMPSAVSPEALGAQPRYMNQNSGNAHIRASGAPHPRMSVRYSCASKRMNSRSMVIDRR
jgi:hypothetical protein